MRHEGLDLVRLQMADEVHGQGGRSTRALDLVDQLLCVVLPHRIAPRISSRRPRGDIESLRHRNDAHRARIAAEFTDQPPQILDTSCNDIGCGWLRGHVCDRAPISSARSVTSGTTERRSRRRRWCRADPCRRTSRGRRAVAVTRRNATAHAFARHPPNDRNRRR